MAFYSVMSNILISWNSGAVVLLRVTAHIQGVEEFCEGVYFCISDPFHLGTVPPRQPRPREWQAECVFVCTPANTEPTPVACSLGLSWVGQRPSALTPQGRYGAPPSSP